MKTGYMIAIDLDGTLLNGIDGYNKEDFEILAEIAKYNYVIIATGRPLRASKYYYDLLELNTPIINYNGALIHNPKDPNFKKIYVSVSKEDTIKILNDNLDLFNNIFCEVEDDLYLYQEADADIEPYLHSNGAHMILGNFKDTLHSDPNGSIGFSYLGSEERLQNYIDTEFKGNLKVRFWWHQKYVVSEIYNPLTTKANGLKYIMDYYNIPFEKTIAIGDGHNDIDMFNATSIGVAMGNSHPSLFSHATYVTDTNINKGVYKFLKEFFYEDEK